MQNRESTNKNYLSVWRQFNKFVIRLDVKPNSWEDKTSLFVAKLIDDGMQSSTVRSYVSAIKRTLINDKYQWDDNKNILTALTRACKHINDRVRTRLPIQNGLLELILFEIKRHFIKVKHNQVYLAVMYQALFAMGYYGLMRVGELMMSQHTVKAKDVHLSVNKEKLLIVLYTSKTHHKGSYPQKIKIVSNKQDQRKGKYFTMKNFCPFKLVDNYLRIRKECDDQAEPFFVFNDGSPITVNQARAVLKQMLANLGLDTNLYDMHSLCIGRCSDMVNKFGYSITEAKWIGCWKSSCVY